MARAGVNRYARSEQQLHRVLRAVTAPAPSAREMVAAGRALFVADPADDVEELARDRSTQWTGRAGRCPTSGPRQAAVTITAAILVAALRRPHFGAEVARRSASGWRSHRRA